MIPAKTVNLARAAASRCRILIYRLLGVRFDGHAWLRSIEIPRAWDEISLGDGVALDSGVVLQCSGAKIFPKIRIGDRVYINRYSMIDANQSIVVEEDAMIGPYVYITDGDHGTGAGDLIRRQPMLSSPVIIGRGAWLGARAIILKGVHIGEGAVVAAGSVVNRDVPPNAIVAGVPARVVRMR